MLPDGENLKEIRKLVEENHEMLKKLRRGQIVERTLRALYWVVIIGAAVGAFYFLQPYVENLQGTYQNIQQTQNSVSNFFGFFGDDEEATSTEAE